MAKKNKVKPDIILKTFWRNNERFADLFNAVLFDGKQVLKPEELVEVDTDLSSLLKVNGHVETVQKIFDVVKKTSDGVEYVIWGLENQEKIHYAMPLRHMLNDSLAYLKECNEIMAEHRKNRDVKSSGEFLSAFGKEDKLHPVISICVYYGEEEWDGPTSLKDMLEVQEEVKDIISDYKMNLIQVRKCNDFRFINSDVYIVFDVIRLIYNEEYTKINTLYKDKMIDTELALVIGSITGSQKIINQALEAEKEGEKVNMNMCKALEKLEQKGVEFGIEQKNHMLAEMMLQDNEPIEKIKKYTGYTSEQIQKIADELIIPETEVRL